MKRSLVRCVLLLCTAVAVAACSGTPTIRTPTGGQSGQPNGLLPGERVLATGLTAPSSLVWGPDNALWATDRVAKQVVRINPDDGTKTTALTVQDAVTDGPGEGLLGLAFGGGSAFVAYTYDASPNPPAQLRTKIVKYNFTPESGTLTSPADVITNLPASPRLNGGGLLVGPDQKLYYTVGDLGNNEGDRACQAIMSQSTPTAAQLASRDWSSYAGKVLRFSLDGSVPGDNPTINGVRSHVYGYGFRDPVGVVTGPQGRIFAAEAGYRTDDEIDLLHPGGNYGWPFVAGFRDDAGYRYANWSAAPNCSSQMFDDYTVPSSVPKGPTETQWNNANYADPLKTLFTVPTGYNFQDPTCGQQFPLCWPAIGSSGLAYLPADDTPDQAMANTLLVSSGRNGAVYALPLTGDGASVQGDVRQLFRTNNVYRGIAVSSDHATVYLATDSQGTVRPRSATQSGQLANPGAILAFHLGEADGGAPDLLLPGAGSSSATPSSTPATATDTPGSGDSSTGSEPSTTPDSSSSPSTGSSAGSSASDEPPAGTGSSAERGSGAGSSGRTTGRTTHPAAGTPSTTAPSG